MKQLVCEICGDRGPVQDFCVSDGKIVCFACWEEIRYQQYYEDSL